MHSKCSLRSFNFTAIIQPGKFCFSCLEFLANASKNKMHSIYELLYCNVDVLLLGPRKK